MITINRWERICEKSRELAMGSAGAKRSATPLWSDAPPAPKALLLSHARPATESAVAAPLCQRTPHPHTVSGIGNGIEIAQPSLPFE
ncbi:MAG TPA: hypothetical protein DCE44_02950 [Verrucomicrobiales bacterium]|nr:hypothetical protein [Verrucomicrobiales bacterium]